MKSILLALAMFVLVSCEKPTNNSVVLSKQFIRKENSSKQDTFYLYIDKCTEPIQVKEYFWKLSEVGDTLLTYKNKAKLTLIKTLRK